ncbi:MULTISPECIES: ligand-binding sensor domain-containing protein [Clostridium]|uniref:histidine kinase n=1 Tax=Clostridium saudiense TaxID=1414720 RepID=A0ABS2FFM2_9CLOT|nr:MULTISPECIES: ATP-binding protein [Clostridium]MBM6818771.1 histidine kinase [Clostridium saudiense]
MIDKLKKIIFIISMIIITNENLVFSDSNISNNGGINFKRITIEDGLSQTTVEYIYQDSDGYMWFGTDDGLNKYDGINFEVYKYKGEDENSISGNIIVAIIEDNDGYIWVGSNDEGVNIIDRSNDKVYRLDKEGELNSLLTSTDITVINGYDNKIFIGTNNGINIIDKDKKEIIKYLESDSSFDSDKSKIREIYIDKDKLVWIGTRDGLYTMDENYKFSNLNDIFKDNNINDRVISSVYEDSDGEIWIGLSIDGGLVRYNKDTGKVINYTSNDKNGLSYNSVKDINGDSSGNIWIATNYGLNKFNKSENKFTQYTEKEGLSNNFIYGILFDEEENPWVSTNYGVSKYDINKEKFVNFSISDGLQGNEFNGYSYFKASDGEMFFGGISGLNSFYPKDYKEREIKEKVNISKVQINGKSINFDDVIKLGRENNSIQIQYFLADYRNVSKIKYYYKMEGIDDDWISAENMNYVSYNNLFAGEYEFQVVAINSYGDMGEVESIKIIKDPPIFMSKTAFAIYLIVIAFILYRRWNRVKILNKLVEQRTEQLNNKLVENKILYEQLINQEKRKNNYFINLSHELRTPLNVILSIEQLITVLNKKDNHIDKKKLNHYMEALRGNSKRLLKLINDIIDTAKIESGMYKLDMKDNDIVYLVEELALSMKDFIESKDIELIIDPEIEEKIIECDAGEIEKCIVNVLGNAAKFTEAGGRIEVIITEENGFVNIKVKDTGIGIDKKDMKSIFDRFGQAYNKKTEEFGGSGIGLSLTKQIIELHNGELLVNSELGKGSEFTMRLPEKQP